MKIYRYGFFALIIGGIISLLIVAVKRKDPSRSASEEANIVSVESPVTPKQLETHAGLTNNIRTNRIVTLTISPKFGGFKKQQ